MCGKAGARLLQAGQGPDQFPQSPSHTSLMYVPAAHPLKAIEYRVFTLGRGRNDLREGCALVGDAARLQRECDRHTRLT